MPSAFESSGANRLLGDFEIVREIGRGGMGVVYEARQLSLKRKVALKVLRGGLALTPTAVPRFRREAEAAAKLHHTNIVPVYATGEQDGTYYYAMELIEGPSLDKVLQQLRQVAGKEPAVRDDPRDDPGATAPYTKSSGPSANGIEPRPTSSLSSGSHYFDTVARMMADVAEALDHAHRHGVIHRDIKPSNLLLLPDARLTVNDFGLARLLEEPGMTTTGEFVGTPAYMSPEQITSGRVPIDLRTDLYSLGATLYELLTLQLPFRGTSRDQILAGILSKEPPAPRTVNPRVPVDLETICLKCLEKDPDRRYQSGQALAEDLRRHVNRFAILARRPGPVTRLRKWVKRNPLVAGALLIVVLALGVAGFFADRSYQSEQRAEADRKRHETELRDERRKGALERAVVYSMSGDFARANGALDDAVTSGASAAEVRFLRGQIALHRGQPVEALEHLEEAVRLAPRWPAAGAMLLRALWDLGRADEFYRRWATMRELGLLSPESAADYLYLGQVITHQDTAEGLRLLDRAVELRDSALGRLVRAEARIYRASDTGTIEDAEAALHAAATALAALPGNPVALAISLEAQLTVAGSYRRLGAEGDAEQALRQAARIAEELKAYPSISRAALARAWFLDQKDDVDELRAEFQREPGGAVGRPYFFALYRRGEFEEALRVLEQVPRAGTEVMYLMRRGFTLPNLPGGKTKALEEYHAWFADEKRWFLRAGYAHMILLFLGEKRELVEVYRTRVKGSSAESDWDIQRRQYRVGSFSTDQLLAAAGSSQFKRCEAHFLIGLFSFADGKRQEARQHFEKVVATEVFPFIEYEWSRALLARMNADPTWPPWIQAKK